MPKSPGDGDRTKYAGCSMQPVNVVEEREAQYKRFTSRRKKRERRARAAFLHRLNRIRAEKKRLDAFARNNANVDLRPRLRK